MLKYRGHRLVRAGTIGFILLALVVTVGLAPEQLLSQATSLRYQALFAEAGGLVTGNKVAMSGIRIGTVDDVSLRKGKAVVTFTVDAKIRLGSDSTAHVRTGTLLGERVLTIESAGRGRMSAMDVIPASRTSSPYSLAEAVDDLTTNAADLDTRGLNQSLDTLAVTLDRVAPQLRPTFEGLTEVSKALAARDESLSQLLDGGRRVSNILGERSQQVNTLILNANDLLEVLNARRHEIVELLVHTSELARQLTGLVHDNEAELAPTLDKLNSVVAMLEKNRDNIAKALPGLAKFQNTLGETVANGPFYSAYIPNLDLPQILQPFFDYAFGFRRGVDQGAPPDNIGPRTEIPFPYNGIPPESEKWPR